MTRVEINGEPPSEEALYRAATRSYGHYTSMQVRGGRVPGLRLHLERLRAGSAELFPDAAPPSDERVRALIRHALGGTADASVRVTVLPDHETETEVMVAVSPPVPDVPRAPLRVRTTPYQRELPHLKHVATLGLSYHARQARAAGYDDVLFVGADGVVSEGSVWNAVFWDGERVIWPEAPMLAGITMQVLRQGLDRVGVPQQSRRLIAADLRGLRAAATTNSHCPAQPIASIDGAVFTGRDQLTDTLWQAWRAVAPDDV